MRCSGRQEFMHAMRGSDPRMRTLADRMEQDEVVRWAGSLPRARVTRWGGMISTPDAVLKVGNGAAPVIQHGVSVGAVEGEGLVV